MRARPIPGRSFTLVELMIYLALVSVGLATFLTLEMGARDSLSLQNAILDVEEEARRYLDALRRDVEAAKTIQVGEQTLDVVRQDGKRIHYALGARRETDDAGKPIGEESFPRTKALAFRIEGGAVVAELSLQRATGSSALERRYRRVASPRASGVALERAK